MHGIVDDLFLLTGEIIGLAITAMVTITTRLACVYRELF